MDEKSLTTLEFPKVLDRLAAHAAFSASKELARGLIPATDHAEVQRLHAGTTEARRMLAMKADLSIGGARDVRPRTWGASRGAVLEPTDLLDVKSTLLSARTLRRWFEKSTESFPILTEIAQRMNPIPGMVEAISAALDDRGEIRDTASPKLGDLRRESHVVRERLETKLEHLIGDSKVAAWLQEPIVTQREGRYVIPLRAEFKGRLKAIVHDQSASGATLFVEPLVVVDLNNRLKEVELEEKEEVRRILAELSARVGAEVESIIATVDALAQLDLAFAKARYAASLNAAEPILLPAPGHQPPAIQRLGSPFGVGRSPEVGDRKPAAVLRLRRARHPLLDPETVVPIDLVLDQDTRALVLTGPNTGGKTVSLKTAGLLSLMAGAGLHLPVESGSELSLFEDVFADIGDEQSIEQSLSTFSSHVANIVRIMKHADARSLVLLDELGAGTDPQEGAALARAILDEFLARGSTTLVATHYPELKTYAHATPGARNASVEFDLETLRPTYRLTIGLPGRSNALAIAERLGLDRGLIERARGLLSPDDVRAEGLLEEIHHQHRVAEEDRARAQAERLEAETNRAHLVDRLETIEEERRRVLDDAREQARRELEALDVEVRQIRRRLAAAGQSLEEWDQLAEKVDAMAEARAEPVSRRVQVDLAPARLRLGDRVQLPRLGTEGVVTEVGLQEVEVQIGRLRVRARLDEVVGVGATGQAATVSGARPNTSRPPAPQALEIDLRGWTAEEALAELESRLDAAVRAGVPFLRVIHGKGTGRLRQAIRQALKTSPYVADVEVASEAEGGDGVTRVRLADF
ncbi:MAG: Smr/MutS family protein [Anaerolineales bacterium]